MVPALATCEMGGRACAACDPTVADGCDAITGTCRCGPNVHCSAGTACTSGACHCNELSCPNGCCAGDSCVSPPTTASCGRTGVTCVACDPATADTCSPSGTCQCGSGPPCGSGLRCASGTCVCDPISCPAGCCGVDGVCQPGTSAASCGTAGTACQQCQGPCQDHHCQ
jgi:hypothetical protein